MKTRSEIFTEVLVRNNRTTTDGFISDTILTNWYRDANIWASGYKKWPFSEGRVATTYTTGGGDYADEYYFEGYKADSFRIVTVGGDRLKKIRFDDYLILREQNQASTEKVYSDYGRVMFINPNAGLSGTIVAYGQLTPAIDATDDAGTPVFSNFDDEGNEAIVEKMTSYLKRREHLMNEADAHDARANLKLDEVWKKIQDEQYNYETTLERGGMWNHFPIVDESAANSTWNRDFQL